MSRLIWSPSSIRDLRGIDLYLQPIDGAVAGRMLRATRSSADRLRGFPRIGRAVEEPFRVLVVRSTPYLLVYRIVADGVEIVRVRHERQDWQRDIEVKV